MARRALIATLGLALALLAAFEAVTFESCPSDGGACRWDAAFGLSAAAIALLAAAGAVLAARRRRPAWPAATLVALACAAAVAWFAALVLAAG